MMKKYVGLLSVLILFSSCATIQTKMGEVAMKLMTKKEKDFGQIAALGLYQSNMYSPETGITLGSGADWQEGQTLVGVQLLKPDGSVGFINLDGTVTVDGKEAPGYGGGVYMAKFDEGDTSPKTVRLENVDGDVTEFTISAAPSVSIRSINGMRENATINMNEELELELDFNEAARGKRVRIALITKAVGVKGFAYFQSTLIDNKITVPANAFLHKHIAGGVPTGKDVTNWATGENHLQVSIVEDNRENANQPFTYFKRTSTAFDTQPVTLEGDVEGRAYIRIKGSVEEANGKFSYNAYSSNAWYARPLNTQINRIGLASLSINGTLFEQETETSESETDYGSYRVITTTTTTTTFEFPQLDDRYWNQFMENMYADLVQTLESDFGASVVDVDAITSNPIYNEFYEPEDENTKVYIKKNFRDTKRLVATSLGEILSDRSTAMIADAAPMPSLLRDMDLDALLNISIDYRVAANSDDKIVLLPLVSFQITGQTQAFDGMANTWMQGSFEGPGVPFSRDEFTDLNALNRIGQKNMIINLIKKTMQELTAEQSRFGYDEVWNVALSN